VLTEEVVMTVKVVALWGSPNDPEKFEEEYGTTHIPLVAALPGLKGAVASKALDGPFYRMAEMTFDDIDAMQSALGSDEGQRLLADAGRLQQAYEAKLDVMTVEEQARI
jgi:uncharacterized protein (TIGR02118 family)